MSKAKENNVIYSLINRGISRPRAYWIVFKFAPHLLPQPCKTFEDLRKNFPSDFANANEKNFENLLNYEEVQSGVKWLMKRLDGQRDIELYNKYYDLAMDGNVQALKAYMDFKEKFFEDIGEDDLRMLIRNANVPNDDDETEDDFVMKL